MRLAAAVMLLAAALTLPAGYAESAESGVIFMYHHVDAATPASTSVRPDEFAAQIEWLSREGFTAWPLLDLLERLEAGAAVPERAVAITFDDAYSSILTTAAPILQALDWPFTVFVSTEAIDQGYRGYLSWDQLRQIADSGATFGNHSVSHTHLVRQADGETRAEWTQRIEREITLARQRLEAELGTGVIPVFAYPYGEYTRELKDLLAGLERYGLGQHSGAVGARSDFLALPRYPVASGLELADFALRARSRPLPVAMVGREQHVLAADEVRPTLRLQLAANDDIRIDELACYVSGQGRATFQWRDDVPMEFVVQPTGDLRPGRSKVNCTAPSRTQSGVWYWYGYVWMRRLQDGRWYEE